MSLKRSIGNMEYMKKRIPKNDKYQHIKTRLDTGCSLTKYMEKLEDIKRNYRYRKDEIFKRLKVTSFAQLILQVASVSDLIENENDSDVQEDVVSVLSEAETECLSEHTNGSAEASPLSDRQSAGGDSREMCHSARSTLLSVISGVGELNMDRTDEKKERESVISSVPTDRPYPDCPYLLLDVRDHDLYNLCHIISAHSFPVSLLSRTMNPYTREVLQFKNADGKIIIVYDEDERIASQAATTMCQRGFENLFLLSGGDLSEISRRHDNRFLPSFLSVLSYISEKRKSSVQTFPAAEQRWRFTSEELNKLQEQLDEILIPSSTSSRMSSRMSASSAQSTASSTQSRQSSGTGGRNSARVQSSRPWK